MRRKSIKSICMIILIFIAVMVAAFAQNSLTTTTFTGDGGEQQAETKKENPAPPDEDFLRLYGIEPFVSSLPVIMIDTKNQQILKESAIWGEAAVYDDPSGGNDIFAVPQKVLTTTVKYRGASSYYGFDKPQYRIKFYDKPDGKSLDYDLFGLGADSEWVLNGPFLDRTLLRNYLMYNLSSQIMDWAPSCNFCELFVDGQYQGVYLAIEPVTDGASRLRLSRFGLVSGATAYIVKRDRVGTELNVIHTYGETAGYTGNELSVEYPSKNKLTELQRQWIEQDISEFEKALYGDDFDNPDTGYAEYIDVDSFVDYFILNEFSMNHDAGVLSTYIYKELNGKIQICVWDFNNAFDNYIWSNIDNEAFLINRNYWFDRLMQDRGFVEKVENRYKELRKAELSEESIFGILEQGQELLGDAKDRNFAVWGYTFGMKMLVKGPDDILRDPTSYEEAIAMLKNTIQKRLAFMDESIGELYKYCIN